MLEKQIMAQCTTLLKLYEKMNHITWFVRLNSGMIFMPNKKGAIRLCRPGTPDMLILTNTGRSLWLEMKTKLNKQTPEQVAFEQMVKGLPNQSYLIIRSVEQLKKVLDQIKIDNQRD